MKRKLFLQISITCLLSIFLAHSAYAITQLGRNPFYSTPIESEDEMVQMLLTNKDDVKAGLVKAGRQDLYEPLMAQLPDAEVSRVQYSKGQKLEWMFYRKNGKGAVRVDKDVVWESDEPLRSYEFFIDHGGQRYTFSVPPVCGNLALVGIGPVPAAAPPVAPPPVVEATPPAEKMVEEAAVSPRFPFLFDAGYLHQLDPSHHVLLRIGMEFPLSDNFSIIGMVGGAPKTSGTEGDDAFIADVFANYSFSRFFVGLGVGAWLSRGDNDFADQDDDFDLIFNTGARIFGEADGFNTSVFVEVRSGVDELDEFDLYGRIAGGLRFRF